MRISMIGLVISAALIWSAAPAAAADGPWSGTWVTDEGAMELTQDGSQVTGTYGHGGTIEGKASGKKFKGSYSIKAISGTFEFERTDDSFKGKWMRGGNSGTWRGWQQDPKAESKPKAKFDGYWVSSLGSFRLSQKGAKVAGPWRNQGWCSLDGEVKGARLKARLQTQNWRGNVWLEKTKDGKRIFGLTSETPPSAVFGALVEGFDEKPKLKAGEIAQGVSENGMLYFIRPPTGWKKGKKVDTIVLLHGSNWTTKGMTWVTPKNWPDLGKQYMIVGIQGDQWSKFSDPPDLRFNYHYVNYTGRSTYKGFPFTDRDSPKLVSDVVTELSERHKWDRVFIGGHSQGGFLSFYMYMHFPEQFAGVFPISGGLVMQCEPDVFEDEDLQKAQRDTPLAIVHGSKDTVVPYSTALYIRDRFSAHGFPMLTLIDPPLGHPYDFLPIGDAIAYLDAMSTKDAKVLIEYANDAAKQKRWAVVGAALHHADRLKARKKLSDAENKLNAAAASGAKEYAKLLAKGKGGKWVSDFFDWKRDFAGASAAAETLATYETLRADHDPKAKTLIDEARAAFNQRDRTTGKAKYEEMLETAWAAAKYPVVKRWVEDMK